MKKNRHNRKLFNRMGLGLLTAVLAGAMLLILAVSGSTGSTGSDPSPSSHQYGSAQEWDYYNSSSGPSASNNTDVDVVIDVDNVVQILVQKLCSPDCPQLRTIFTKLFSLDGRVRYLELDQRALAEDINRVERFAVVRISQLAGIVGDLKIQTQHALDSMAGRIEAVRARTASDIAELQKLQARFQASSDARVKYLQGQIERVQKQGDAKITALQRQMTDIQRDATRREAALRKDINRVQRNTNVKITALESSILKVKRDLTSLDSRVTTLERNIPELVQAVGSIQKRLISVESRLADTERTLGYLLTNR